MKKILVCLVVLIILLSGCQSSEQKFEGTYINLSDDGITVDGKKITNDSTDAVYSANDIVFYHAGEDFTYGEGSEADEHEQSEADAHTVVHITQPGRYVLSGTLSLGQVAIDLGEDAQTDPNAIVTIILNDVDITCKVAPAIIFYNVYECCNSDEETATKDVSTENAGANVIIADGTENNINGSYVAKIYKSYELSEDGTTVVDSKKLHKYDGAFYSKKSMNINGGDEGTGVLNIKAENEGLNSELHLTINGGIINIQSGNDGINTNEDNVSVTTINGGTLNIVCDGSTGEGDGIDSNGWLVINGGTLTAQACSSSGDAGIDSDKGIYINGGKVVASGNMLDNIAGGEQTYAIFNFASRQIGNNTYTLKNSVDEVIGEYIIENDFSYLIVAGDELATDDYTFWQGEIQLSGSQAENMSGGIMNEHPNEMPGGAQEPFSEFPEGMEGSLKPDGSFGKGERPENFDAEKPEMPEGMTPPDNGGKMMQENMMLNGEKSTLFTIVKGANFFFGVGPANL